MNKSFIAGRLTAKPAISTVSNDLKRATFTVAVDRKRRGAEGQSNADFLRIVCFGSRAEFIEQYVEQGDMVSVVGRIETGSYTDKNNNRVNTFNILADEVELIRKHKRPKAEATEPAKQTAPTNFMELGDDDELPFN